ncbi:TrmB family transcriptional regulator [Methanosphaerula palustris]|uniref:Transcriptional regulator, TrmB n=1 Tax=Methanosphaerula palustris (strain ATCC BAA-1556 / DSM 19958 / E1-9c) TaxID=521011 RepID=B8GF77_METPE|nr:helix-turn-helix domain-containing protein [Methanosphaerula palustris]ACL17883.1 transcriptional regulator, TrmB [Methanosphaerula palustris E1-9c]
MIDDSLLLHLKGIGMSEYEAKVYVILSALRVASAREIHEQTKIPRGRIYETLTSLAQKGFIVSSGTSPVRYSPVDVFQMFEQLKQESVKSLDGLYQRLKALETETPEPLMQGYKLSTEWTRDNQIRMMLRRAKSELILLCNDEVFITRYGSDISRAAKRVLVYLVVGRKELAQFAPIKCFTGGSDIEASLFHHEEGEKNGLSMQLLLMADRRESLSILEDNGRLTGIFICPDIYASYLSRKIVQEIQPVDRSRR